MEIEAPITQDLTIDGDPKTAHGTIQNVPAGMDRLVLLEAFPALPGNQEDDVVIYRGDATTDVEAAQISNVEITLSAVVGDVDVTAEFSADDIYIASIEYIEVLATGNRISDPTLFYLVFDDVNDIATGIAEGIPVGVNRTITVKTYDDSDNQLHEGSASTPVEEGGTSVTVTMDNVTGMGGVNINGTFCESDCTGRECGDDGCGSSCGGCRPGHVCEDGLCAGHCENRLLWDHSFDDNQTPQGWTLDTWSGGGGACGIMNGRLESRPTDSQAWLHNTTFDVPDDAGRLVVEWDGNHANSAWGIRTGLHLYWPATGGECEMVCSMYTANSEPGFEGPANKVLIRYRCPDGTDQSPIRVFLPQQSGEFHYRVEVIDGHVSYIATWLASGETYFNYSASIPVLLSEFSRIALETHCTGQVVWADNFSATTECF